MGAAGSGQLQVVKQLWIQLWREIFGEPPPLADDSELLCRVLLESLPLAPPYEPGPPRPALRDNISPSAHPRECGDPGVFAGLRAIKTIHEPHEPHEPHEHANTDPVREVREVRG